MGQGSLALGISPPEEEAVEEKEGAGVSERGEVGGRRDEGRALASCGY